MKPKFSFAIERELPGTAARAGVISTPHGEIETPAFIAVGTNATVRALTPEQAASTGAQAVLANAYHLYLRPGSAIVDAAGGVGKFMNWPGPTFTDSGGFQVMSLGVGYKKVLAMDTVTSADDVIARPGSRLATVDEDGVTFTSHIDGSKHRFTAEVSMRIQHSLGADIIFAFDECTAIANSRAYQEESLDRTHRWAKRSLDEHQKLTTRRAGKPYQALFGVVQGAQYEDLRRASASYLGSLDFDGYGLGGAYEKNQLGTIVRWMTEELPKDKPRHMLGISDPRDMFEAIENGADTFDCVAPTREGRNGAIYTPYGRKNFAGSRYRTDFGPLVDGCACYTCQGYSRAYLHHLFKAKERLAATLASIHNEYFIVGLVREIRESILDGSYPVFKTAWLGRYYGQTQG